MKMTRKKAFFIKKACNSQNRLNGSDIFCKIHFVKYVFDHCIPWKINIYAADDYLPPLTQGFWCFQGV